MTQRHKCSVCGKVRFERFVAKIMYDTEKEHPVKTRYGNECWACVDNPDCRQKAKFFRSY